MGATLKKGHSDSATMEGQGACPRNRCPQVDRLLESIGGLWIFLPGSETATSPFGGILRPRLANRTTHGWCHVLLLSFESLGGAASLSRRNSG